MAALTQSGIRSGSIEPPVSSSAPQAAASSAARSRALLGPGRVGREEQVAAVGVEAERAPRLARGAAGGSGSRSGPQGRTAEPGTGGRPGRPSSAAKSARETAGDEVDAPGEPARERADDAVADVGAVEGDDQRPRAGQPRAPAGQPVVGVDEVEALAGAAARRSRRVAGMYWLRAGREAEHLHLDPAPPHLVDLVPHPAPPLGGGGVGLEVGDDQDAHPAEGIRGTGAADPVARSADISPTRIGASASGSVRRAAEHRAQTDKEASMVYALMGYVHAAIERRVRAIRALAATRGGRARSSTSA